MHVCFLSSMHPPFDKRVFEKEARALAAAGYRVTHLAPADTGDEVVDGIQIRTYRKPVGIVGRLFALPALYRRARRVDADVYHCNEFDSFIVGVALGIGRRRCVLDVHEFFAHDFAENHSPRALRSLVYRGMSAAVRWLARRADAVVLANAALGEDYRHLPPGRVVAVENFGTARLGPPRSGPRRPPFRLVHLGVFGASRGSSQILEALALASRKDVELHCAGEFTGDSASRFERDVVRLGLHGRVHVRPWLPRGEAMALLRSADIGLILFQPGLHAHDHALPHKLFDYMSAELAVIAPRFSTRIAAIVEDAGCGVLVDATSPASIAAAIDELCADPSVLQRLGANGRAAVFDRYNWEREAERLLGVYSTLG